MTGTYARKNFRKRLTMSNGCVTPEGRLSDRALMLLKLLKERGKLMDTDIAELTQRPLFQVRSSLRELTNAGFLKQDGSYYLLTEKAEEAILQT